jgi:hypothetical protein
VIFNRNRTSEVIVKPRLSPRAKLLVAAGVAAAVIGTISFIYNYGLSMAGFERHLASRLQDTLHQENRRLEAENQELREALARAQRSVQMSETAHQELDRSLKASAQEIVKLREELNFYRNIISPADKKGGLRIQGLYIEPAGGSNRFRYKLVLIQALKHDQTVYGNAVIEIHGTQAGQETVVRLPASNDKPIAVNLKYFQDIEGRFELPRNFRPERIRVNVSFAGGTQSVAQQFAWPLT